MSRACSPWPVAGLSLIHIYSRDTGSASDYLPHNYPVNSVAYTGTHDNETLVSWYQTISDAERAKMCIRDSSRRCSPCRR